MREEGRGPAGPGGAAGPGGSAEDAEPGAAGGAAAAARCPFCGSEQTEVVSLFGSTLLTSQCYCRRCRSVFEQVKWGRRAAR
jgi:hypothetical protein